MIGSFASEGGRPAIFLPEQVEVLAHGGFLENWFSRSLQILALPRLLERDFSLYGSSLKSGWNANRTVATFGPAMSHKLYMCPRRIAFELLLDRSRKTCSSNLRVALANADVIRPKMT